MQNLQDIQEKIFFESKSILETLSKINSKDELLAKQDLFTELTDRIAFLRILEKNKDSFIVNSTVQDFDNQELNSNIQTQFNPSNEENLDSFKEESMEEEVLFTNELNDIENEEDESLEPIISEEIVNENDSAENQEAESIIEIESSSNENNYENRISEKEREFLELEERRRKIVEFSKEDIAHPPKEIVLEEAKNQENIGEKKFKLANIKGLKAVQNLFDEDPLEKFEEQEHQKFENKLDSGSVLKNNIPTDFMEAEKRKPDFKLDLNDRVTFIKFLFNGNVDELKSTIDKLNSFDNLDDAKQYLSEVYYQKDWNKADEYAQRLWNLVENKFL